ncbi:VOC family protein [Actinomadura verrucosospora]|uniref:VOC family protein n=1 Tax=Actinomadura verrucosospora TaxID=46165 RepID=UPI0015651964|nr:VOC family protein [Actinomadura verrucosospora]
MNGHAPGRPSWAELASPAPKASKDFYCSLFGWYVYTLTVPDYDDYDIFTLGGIQGPEVAGMQRLADDAQPPSWSLYFRTDDVQATVETVKEAGGQELVAPLRLADLGEMALCSDPEGADFALWSPGTLQGAGVVDEAGAMCWAELACRDVDKARRFYGTVFGWQTTERRYYVPYTNLKLGEWSFGGMVDIEDLRRNGYEADPHWIPYFWVEDCDATAARAAELGGRALLPPTDIEPGRYSVLADPAGARLAVITPAGTGAAPEA